MIEAPTPDTNLRKRSFGFYIIILISIIIFLSSIFVSLNRLLTTPALQTQQTFVVEKGFSVKSIAKKAKKEGVVRSEFILYSILTLLYDPTNIHAGNYIFDETSDILAVAKKLAQSEAEQDLFRLTIPEGSSRVKIAIIANNVLPKFAEVEYLENTADYEGYLFPDTYFIPENFTADDLIDLQLSTFKEKTLELTPLIDSSELSEYEILTLASIVEREAKNEGSMKMVAGILLNRLNIGMPLQADATIEYVLDSELIDLPEGQLAKTLRELDSPYNTYKYKGLTPTPIGNPGLTSIRAVLEPIRSKNLYYITDENGEFHYAETLEQHNLNVKKYLR